LTYTQDMTMTTNAENKAPDVLRIPCTACHGTGGKTFTVLPTWRPLVPAIRRLADQRRELTYRKDSHGTELLRANTQEVYEAVIEASEAGMPQEVIGYLLGVTRQYANVLIKEARAAKGVAA